MNTWLMLIFCLSATYGVGLLGALLTRWGLKDPWYKNLKKPLFNPPPIVFRVVWPLLYTLMSLALWIALRSSCEPLWILVSYGLQLFFNLLWSFFFFTLQSPLLALFDLFFLIAALVWTLIIFYSVSLLAANLLIAYLAWVLFATYLNRFIWLNNKKHSR